MRNAQTATMMQSSSDDVFELLTKATVDVPLAGRVLGIKSKNAAYRAREAGDIPSVKVGGLWRVPTIPLRRMLHLPDWAPSDSPAQQQAA